jgi:hypothetical protein
MGIETDAGKDEQLHERLSNKQYTRELKKLQTRLVEMQKSVKSTGAKIVVVFEGRDAAGKGGVIHAIGSASVRAIFGMLHRRHHRNVRRARCIHSGTWHTCLPSARL